MTAGRSHWPRWRSWRAGAIAALAAAAWPGWAACGPAGWTLAAGAEHSRWRELDVQGRSLLHEQGTLATAALTVEAVCAAAAWQLTLAQAWGRRDYDGRSSSGAPLATRSGIDRSTLALQAWLPLAGPWSAGAGLAYRQLRRDIASTAAVQGYAERFSDWQALASLRHAHAAGAAMTLVSELGLGAGPPGRLALQLPQADAAVLQLGSSRLLQAGLTLRGGSTSAPAPGWQLALRYRYERSAAGPPQALLRQGRVVGGAAQPEVRQSALGLQAGFGW